MCFVTVFSYLLFSVHLYLDGQFSHIYVLLLNLKLADVEADISQDMIISACETASADEFISQLPDKYEVPNDYLNLYKRKAICGIGLTKRSNFLTE